MPTGDVAMSEFGAQLHPACEVAGQAGKGHRGEALPCISNVAVGVEERLEGRGGVGGWLRRY